MTRSAAAAVMLLSPRHLAVSLLLLCCCPPSPRRRESERYKEATGKDVGDLEATKAAAQLLQSRSMAQVELNANLHEQVVLLREEKELAQQRLQRSMTEAKSLAVTVGGMGGMGKWEGVSRGCCCIWHDAVARGGARKQCGRRAAARVARWWG